MGTQQTVRRIARSCVPWWMRGALKLAAVKAGIRYSTLRRFSLAQHGGMERPDWALQTFRSHFDAFDFNRKAGGFTCLELGPGDSLSTALIALAFGASATYLVDVGPFANLDPALYRAMAAHLRELGMPMPDFGRAASTQDILEACGGNYLTRGLESLRELPTGGVDLIFSNTVLQHVRLPELASTLAQLRRVIHPRGCSVHSLDLRDMLGQSLHHLRFPQRLWESTWCRQAEFYTNRLMLPQWVAILEQAGFEARVIEDNRWPRLPVKRSRLSQPYRDLPEEQLCTATARIVAIPASGSC